jgi:hypothetical protein
VAAAPSVPGSNLLLAPCPQERDQFLSLCEPFEMQFGAVLCDVDTPYRHAYFPVSGLISLVSVLHDQNPLEMALVGQDGMLGATLVLGIGTFPSGRWCTPLAWPCVLRRQGSSGSCAIRRRCAEILNRYLYLRLVELSLVGACIRYHRIEQRLARALLLADDRATVRFI